MTGVVLDTGVRSYDGMAGAGGFACGKRAASGGDGESAQVVQTQEWLGHSCVPAMAPRQKRLNRNAASGGRAIAF